MEKSPVCMLMLAPKAPAPIVEVPAPRCTCISLTEEAKSGRLTQNTVWLSASLMGIPLAVTSADYIYHSQTVDGFSFIQTLQIYMIKVILGIQQRLHRIADSIARIA